MGIKISVSLAQHVSESVKLLFLGSKEGLWVTKFLFHKLLVDLISQAFVEDLGSSTV